VVSINPKEDFNSERLDEVDRRILDVLQIDAGLTNEALARRAHVSPATCLRRVRRLTRAGVIQRRVALLDPAKLGEPLQVITEVTLDRQGAEHLEEFERRAVATAAVRQCYRVSPGPDFVLFISVANMEAWNALVASLFTQHANVRNVKSFFAVRRTKFDTTLPWAR
jgi:DNA-binding Lrp family transcriptional regulator